MQRGTKVKRRELIGVVCALVCVVGALVFPTLTSASGSSVPGVAVAQLGSTLPPPTPAAPATLSMGATGGNCTGNGNCVVWDTNGGESNGGDLPAASSGTITSWTVAGLAGSAELVVGTPSGGIAASSAPADGTCPQPAGSQPCTTVQTFTTSPLAIPQGDYIGIELIEPSGCGGGGPPYCAFVGQLAYCPTGGPNCTDYLAIGAQETIPPPTMTLSLSPSTVSADGQSSTLAIATITSQDGNPEYLSSDSEMTFASTDPGMKVGPVFGEGTGPLTAGQYGAYITSSEAAGTATITATDLENTASATAKVTEVGPTIRLSISPTSIPADGKSTATATATITDSQGYSVTGANVTMTSSGDALVGFVTDAGSGKYVATVTSTHAVGPATITATDNSTDPAVSAAATLSTKAPTTTTTTTTTPTTTTTTGNTPKPPGKGKSNGKDKKKKPKKKKPKPKKKKPKPKPKKKKGNGKGKKGTK